jgi:xylan 1,4-beta-xylosidase
VKFELDFNTDTLPLPHYWELCVGSCHGTTALREDYRRQLEQCRRELGFKYVRFHGLFNDDMSVVIKDGDGYTLSFTNIDSIFDFLLSIGMKPFVELGFMPAALTSGKAVVFHYKGLTSPPDDYEKWRHLVEQFTRHCVERYGLGEMRQWFFEVWNEPNLGGPGAPFGFWAGTQEDYFKLYEAAARGIKAVDTRLRVGGPATSANAWIPEFTAFCRKNSVPVDFVSTHHYPTDDVIGLAIAEIRAELAQSGEGKEVDPAEMMKRMQKFSMSREEMWKKVRRGSLTDMTKKAKAEAGDLPLYYTEWNSWAGLPSDGPFGASFIAKTFMDNAGLVEGYSYWTFSDIFEESGMPHKEFHGGFGLLTLHGVPKAAYRVFQLLHELGEARYETQLSEGTVDVYAVKKQESCAVQILALNHQSLGQDIRPEEVRIRLTGLPGFVRAEVRRIDEAHANALGRWRELGEPDYPGEAVIYDLLSASCLETEKLNPALNGDTVDFALSLPEQGAALITVYY